MFLFFVANLFERDEFISFVITFCNETPLFKSLFYLSLVINMHSGCYFNNLIVLKAVFPQCHVTTCIRSLPMLSPSARSMAFLTSAKPCLELLQILSSELDDFSHILLKCMKLWLGDNILLFFVWFDQVCCHFLRMLWVLVIQDIH